MSQSLAKLYVHLVFSTKHRQPLITPAIQNKLHAYAATVLAGIECPALQIGGTADHIHLLLALSKNLATSA